jgi:hypothetical protein
MTSLQKWDCLMNNNLLQYRPYYNEKIISSFYASGYERQV